MKLTEQFDFRTDKSSWVMVGVMIMIFMFFWTQGAEGLEILDYFKAFGYSTLIVGVLVALMSIPVLVYCYLVKMIPDIDYSIRAAFVFTIIGIISEFIF